MTDRQTGPAAERLQAACEEIVRAYYDEDYSRVSDVLNGDTKYWDYKADGAWFVVHLARAYLELRSLPGERPGEEALVGRPQADSDASRLADDDTSEWVYVARADAYRAGEVVDDEATTLWNSYRTPSGRWDTVQGGEMVEQDCNDLRDLAFRLRYAIPVGPRLTPVERDALADVLEHCDVDRYVNATYVGFLRALLNEGTGAEAPAEAKPTFSQPVPASPETTEREGEALESQPQAASSTSGLLVVLIAELEAEVLDCDQGTTALRVGIRALLPRLRALLGESPLLEGAVCCRACGHSDATSNSEDGLEWSERPTRGKPGLCESCSLDSPEARVGDVMTCFCACGGLKGHNPATCCHARVADECAEDGRCGTGPCQNECADLPITDKRAVPGTDRWERTVEVGGVRYDVNALMERVYAAPLDQRQVEHVPLSSLHWSPVDLSVTPDDVPLLVGPDNVVYDGNARATRHAQAQSEIVAIVRITVAQLTECVIP